jgi:ATP-dependent Clp protease adaptor protein ClpS
MPFIPINNVQTESSVSTELRAPKLWQVKILNDDYTPVDFVVEILMTVFHKSEDKAIETTLAVHAEGSAVLGLYTKDIACTKASKAMALAEDEGHPLRLVPEPKA